MAHDARQSLRPTATGHHAEVHVVVRDPRIVTHEDDVAGLHQLEAAGHRHALDGSDDGLGDLTHGGARIPEGAEQGAQRIRALGPQPLDLLEVTAGTEVAACSTDQHHPDRGIRAGRPQRLLERDSESRGDRVHRVRTVEGDGGDAVGHPRVRLHGGAHMPLPPDTSSTAPVM